MPNNSAHSSAEAEDNLVGNNRQRAKAREWQIRESRSQQTRGCSLEKKKEWEMETMKDEREKEKNQRETAP